MFEGGGIDQQQLDEIKARYGIGGRATGPSHFPIVLIKPSHYDAEGYVIQWYRPAAPSHSLAAMQEVVEDCRQRKVLGGRVEVEIRWLDEGHTRIRTQRLARALKDGHGLVILTDVQTKQFPRAMDLALGLRVGGVQVCMAGSHISRSISMTGGVTPELQEAMNMGVSLFAGEVEQGRLDAVLRDGWRADLKPLYNYLGDPPTMESDGAPTETRGGTSDWSTSLDAGRGWPQQRSFSTILKADGQELRPRTAEEVERIIRGSEQQGAERFFITDEDFSRNPEWEKIFDKLIAMREQEKANFELLIQVDAMSHRLPGFITKAGRAGVRRVFVALESIGAAGAGGTEDRMGEYRKMLLAWKRAGAIVFARTIVGGAGDTREGVLSDVRRMQRELAIDLLEPHCLTDPEHATKTAEREALAREVWKEYYTREHMETVLRRAAATGIPLDDMMRLLLRFHFCVLYEKVDPRQSGYVRRRYRRERRTTMPREKFVGFYRRYAGDLIYRQFKLAELYWSFRRFGKRLERDPDAKTYTDAALTGA